MRFKKLSLLVLCALLGTSVLAGCSAGEASEADTPFKLKVMYYDENSFYQQYGMLFSALYPNIEIEVVSTQSVSYEEGKDMVKAMQDFIAEQNPDVMMLNSNEYARMAGEGKLYNLETFIKKDDFDLEGIAPGVIGYIKEQSDGVLYGLAPSFYSQAIYYNKDLFTKYGVPLPTDRMSWDELLGLAARFPTTGPEADRVYGLKMGYQSRLFDLAFSIGTTQGLSFINPTTKQVTINSDSWKTVFETADKALKSGAIYKEDPNQVHDGTTYESYLLSDPFIGGKTAMIMEGDYLMNQLKEAQKILKDKAVVKNWDLVTVPVNPQSPEESTAISVNQIFTIDANSANADVAWKLVSYLNGDEFARVTSKAHSGGFSSRTKYIANDEGRNVEAFYSLKPAKNPMDNNYELLPMAFLQQFEGMFDQAFQGYTDGKTTISETLDQLQAKGQQVLNEEIEKAKKATVK